jgi:hypothetical protein
MREGCKNSAASEAWGSGVEKFRPGSAGAGETTKPTGGTRVAVTEGEGVQAVQAGMGRARVWPMGEKGGGRGAGWAERPDGPAGHWADWAESEGKILFQIKFDF